MSRLALLGWALAVMPSSGPAVVPPVKGGALRAADDVQVTILSSNLANWATVGEWDTLESLGVGVIEHDGPAEVLPSVWITGSIPRPHPEKNYPSSVRVLTDGSWVEDHVPDSQGLTIITPRGHIVLMGCGHSGVVNALEHVRGAIAELPVHALMGGLHLFAADDEVLGWTGDRLREVGVQHLMAGHCTGIEPLTRLRAALDPSRRTAVVGAVGSRFVHGEGIHPTAIAM